MIDCTSEEVETLFKRFRIKDSRTWPFYPIAMPLDREGRGPCDNEDFNGMSYEVWDRYLNTYSSHKYLPDAINESLERSLSLFGVEDE